MEYKKLINCSFPFVVRTPSSLAHAFPTGRVLRAMSSYFTENTQPSAHVQYLWFQQKQLQQHLEYAVSAYKGEDLRMPKMVKENSESQKSTHSVTSLR